MTDTPEDERAVCKHCGLPETHNVHAPRYTAPGPETHGYASHIFTIDLPSPPQAKLQDWAQKEAREAARSFCTSFDMQTGWHPAPDKPCTACDRAAKAIAPRLLAAHQQGVEDGSSE